MSYAIDTNRCLAILTSGSVVELRNLKMELTTIKKDIETQLSNSASETHNERMRLLETGMHGREAEQRAQSAAHGPDWKARATAVGRLADTWLSKIKARLATMQTAPGAGLSAVAIENVATNTTRIVQALNGLLKAGSKVVAWQTNGPDLIVIASEPKHGPAA